MTELRVLVSDEEDDQPGHDIIGHVAGAIPIAYSPNSPELTDVQTTAEVLVPPYRSSHRPIRLLAQLPELRLVQLLSAGVDEWASDVPRTVMLSSARGAHSGPVAEWILSAILTQFRQWPALIRYQGDHVWAHRRFSAQTLRDSRILIIGAGGIGLAAAGLLRAFGAIPTMVASSARGDVHAASELPALIPGHQVVVIAAALTDGTAGLVDQKFLARMDTGALLVNAGRGAIVRTAALVDELRTERLRAALDVTDPEPLPPGHPLWTCPGLIISPHSARTVPGTAEACYAVAAEQIRALVAGENPTNLAPR